MQINVLEAFNKGGIYILNDFYFLNNATFVINGNTVNINDDVIWRPEGSKNAPRISDISVLFTISKNINTDTIFIEKEGNKILLLLSN